MKNNSTYEADILVVDDTHDNLRLLAKLLMDNGYYVRPVSDGKSAIRAIQDQHPDLILLDIMMPMLDGLQATRKLRETMNIPVILVSAKSEDTDKIIGLNFGFNFNFFLLLGLWLGPTAEITLWP